MDVQTVILNANHIINGNGAKCRKRENSILKKLNNQLMKNSILLLSACLFFSCGKSVYYAYEFSNELNDYYSYCTLEITKNKEIIYRASSYKYHHVYPHNNIYVYIYSNKEAAGISKNYYNFGATISDLWTIKYGDNLKMQGGFIYFDYPSDSSISYRIEENDTIVCTTNDFEYLKKGYGYKENGILWFPEYMVKVDKIDYNKFYKSIRHLNLKNPRKTKN
ncbi:MAG TPA: hypothetical protein VF677_05515 [Flavobacterium sp.]|jgi:hypothetical protein